MTEPTPPDPAAGASASDRPGPPVASSGGPPSRGPNEYQLHGDRTWFHGLLRMLRWSVLKGPSTVADRQLSEVNLHWLIHLRWTAIAGQLITILVVRYGLDVEIPLPALFAILLVEFGTNGGLLLFQRNELLLRESGSDSGPDEFTDRRLQLVKLGVMLLDIGLLTTLLSLTGGATNPFCGFLLVYVALGSVLLPLRHSLVVVGALGFAMMMIMEYAMPVPALDASPSLRGWGNVIALSLTSLLTVLFVNRVVSTLATRAQELQSERGRRERQRHLEALGTLAAGAAHELGTPLSTIALVAKELELQLEQEPAVGDAVTADARLIRDEVARCRRILNRMSATAGDRVGEAMTSMVAQELADTIVGEMAAGDRVEVDIMEVADGASLELPREGLATAIRAIVQNGIDASPSDATVRLRVVREEFALIVTVGDRGTGMTSEEAERALEPFFTTKDVGRGMGLGLYLASSFVEDLGGNIEIHSAPGLGTVVGLVLPLAKSGELSVTTHSAMR
ncbi:MAG: ATP-binding protein [Planctomycetota bacterium]|nr:ATP-binding protein [Planctomycetota bacterium]